MGPVTQTRSSSSTKNVVLARFESNKHRHQGAIYTLFTAKCPIKTFVFGFVANCFPVSRSRWNLLRFPVTEGFEIWFEWRQFVVGWVAGHSARSAFSSTWNGICGLLAPQRSFWPCMWRHPSSWSCKWYSPCTGLLRNVCPTSRENHGSLEWIWVTNCSSTHGCQGKTVDSAATPSLHRISSR